MPNPVVQRTGASRFARTQINRQRRLAPVADLCVKALHSMKAKGKRCIVVVFGERGVRYGVGSDGQGSYVPQRLAEFLYSFQINSGGLCRVGCEAYFAYSR